MSAAKNDQAAEVVAQMMRLQGLSLEDLARHLDEDPADTGGSGRYPTVAELVETVERSLTKNTKRTWHTHFKRLVDGVPSQCDCTCAKCLDTDTGCSCTCRTCSSQRLAATPSYGDRVLVKGAFKRSELNEFVKMAQRLSQKKATKDNLGRARRGLTPKAETGKGGAENAVTALRRLFAELVDDELWDKNPALALDKPARNRSKRRSLRDNEIAPFFEVVATGGDDSELDVLLCWFHLESGARQAGALGLQVGRIMPATQVVELYEKGEKVADQPVSAELIDALLWMAKDRGGPACDPRSPQYDPTRPVFYYGHPRRTHRGRPDATGPAPLTGRRYDTIAQRIQRTLPWANEISITMHFMRHTGASIVERIAGTQTARHFLRHADRTVTDTYTHSDDVRLAKAIETMTGAPHPMASESPTT